jgi:hypothetical protein
MYVRPCDVANHPPSQSENDLPVRGRLCFRYDFIKPKMGVYQDMAHRQRETDRGSAADLGLERPGRPRPRADCERSTTTLRKIRRSGA